MLATCLRFMAEEKCSVDTVVYCEHRKWFTVPVLELNDSEETF
jgi:hypothetical protein